MVCNCINYVFFKVYLYISIIIDIAKEYWLAFSLI